jgi:hypothetical protein
MVEGGFWVPGGHGVWCAGGVDWDDCLDLCRGGWKRCRVACTEALERSVEAVLGKLIKKRRGLGEALPWLEVLPMVAAPPGKRWPSGKVSSGIAPLVALVGPWPRLKRGSGRGGGLFERGGTVRLRSGSFRDRHGGARGPLCACGAVASVHYLACLVGLQS